MKANVTTAEKIQNEVKIPTNGDIDTDAIKNEVYALLRAKSFHVGRSMDDVLKDTIVMKQYENDVYEFLEYAEVVPVEVDKLLETIQEAITDLRFEKREIEFWIRENAKKLPYNSGTPIYGNMIAVTKFYSDRRFTITE